MYKLLFSLTIVLALFNGSKIDGREIEVRIDRTN